MLLSGSYDLLSSLVQVCYPLERNNMVSNSLTFSLCICRQTSNVRQVVELNRDYCLLIGQVLFLTVVGLKDHFDSISCIIITFLTHFVWMLVFTWTGKTRSIFLEDFPIRMFECSLFSFFLAFEGFFLYKALVVVFDSGEDHFWFIYLASYGVSAVIVITTLVVSIARNDFYFREDACWLDDKYIWAFKGPVLAIVVLNIIVLVVGLRAACMVSFTRVLHRV